MICARLRVNTLDKGLLKFGVFVGRASSTYDLKTIEVTEEKKLADESYDVIVKFKGELANVLYAVDRITTAYHCFDGLYIHEEEG